MQDTRYRMQDARYRIPDTGKREFLYPLSWTTKVTITGFRVLA